jgi:hypothetical protein
MDGPHEIDFVAFRGIRRFVGFRAFRERNYEIEPRATKHFVLYFVHTKYEIISVRLEPWLQDSFRVSVQGGSLEPRAEGGMLGGRVGGSCRGGANFF